MFFKKNQLPSRLLLEDAEPTFVPTEPENVGIDIALTNDGDLSLSGKGDIELLDPDRSIAVSLLRRVLTPPGGYARIFNESLELVEYGTELENIAYSYLSSNKTDLLIRQLQSNLKALAEVDERIEVISVTLKPSGVNNINIDLTYKTKGSNVLKTLIYQYK